MSLKPLKPMAAQAVSFTWGYITGKGCHCINGMVVDKDDNLILAYKSFLQMYSPNDKYFWQTNECRLEGDAWDISYHKTSGRIVVALQTNSIQFVNNFTPQNKIDVQNMVRCYGVTWVGKYVYVGGVDEHSDGSINILDDQGCHIRNIALSSSIRDIQFLHHRDNNIYFTDKNHVYSIKTDGANLFTFNTPDLQDIYGIDTDQSGNIYVAGWWSNNIVRLSPDGQNSDIVLKQDDAIKQPQTLCFSRDYKKLLVSDDKGMRVTVYNCDIKD